MLDDLLRVFPDDTFVEIWYRGGYLFADQNIFTIRTSEPYRRWIRYKKVFASTIETVFEVHLKIILED